MKQTSLFNRLLLLCFFSSVSVWGNAQSDPCGFELAMEAEFQQNPAYATLLAELQQNPGQGQGPTDGTYEIPTVVHIIHNNGPENISDQQVLDAIAQANNQLAGGEGGFNTQIQLVLARISPNGSCTNGINRVQYAAPDADLSNPATDITLKNLSRWDPSKYLNVWIVRCILPDDNCNDNSGYGGYAYFPGASSLLDGIVIAHRYFGETGTASGNTLNTLAHEFGHYAFLYHVWGPEFSSPTWYRCHPNSLCLTQGDKVCDTPPCHKSFGGCTPSNTCDQDDPDENDPIENYMSYRHACQDRFTEGQAQRMYQFALDNIRANLWSDANQVCTGIAGFYGADVVINSTTPTNWTTANLPNNGNILIQGNLVIESGSTLTIGSGVVVRFCSNGRLIIQPNARLNLSGTLTNSCGEPWKGVEVWGNSSQSQYTQNGVNAQGRLVCSNGSVIENADIGVQLWGPDYAANAGGIISCSGATFRNNRRAVEFAPYVNTWPFPVGPTGQAQNYAGSFGRCTFVTNDNYPNPSGFEGFIFMKGVRGIGITGCTFTNEQNISASQIKDYGYGVYAIDAGFRVVAACNGITLPCTSYTNSEFTNLGYAVYTANVVGNQPFTVQQARFRDCYFGIYNKAVSQGTVLFNQFFLGNVPHAGLTQDQFGTFFEAAMSGFTFQENSFVKISGNVTNTVGSYNKDLAFFDGNVLRRNNYIGLKFGNIAEKTNAYYGTTPPRGLHYLCNTNTGVTDVDFTVLPSSTIRRDQGLLAAISPLTFLAAGNKFSQIGIDFLNQGGAQILYHRNPSVALEDPITISGNIQKVNANPNSCLVEYCNPPCKEPAELEVIKADYYAKRNQYILAKSAYNGALMNGNSTLAQQKAYEMQAARYAMDNNSLMIVLHLLYDTTGYNRDTLRAWYSRMDNPAAQLQLSRDYLAAGLANQATSAILQAPTLFELDNEDANDYYAIANIFNLIGSQSVYALNTQTLSALDDYVNDNGKESAVLAQNIKSWYGDYFPPQYELPSGLEERAADQGQREERSDANNWNLSVAPNPTSGNVSFMLKGEKNQEMEWDLRITDLNGKLIWSQQLSSSGESTTLIWDAGQMPNGIYPYRLTSVDGENIMTGRIVVHR